jgi:hypothetical protein
MRSSQTGGALITGLVLTLAIIPASESAANIIPSPCWMLALGWTMAACVNKVHYRDTGYEEKVVGSSSRRIHFLRLGDMTPGIQGRLRMGPLKEPQPGSRQG